MAAGPGAGGVVASLDGPLQQRPLLTRLIGDRGEVVDDAGIEIPKHHANAIAQKARIGIAAVEAGSDVALREKSLDLRPRDVEQRTDDAILTDGMNPSERRDAAAGHQTHQHRLGLIVLLMRGGDERVACHLPQPRMPYLARRRFDAAMPNGLGVERPIGNAQRDVVPRAELAHIRFVVVRLRGAKVVIDVRGGEFDLAHLHECNEQRGGVDAARDRAHDRPPHEIVCSEEAPDGLDDHVRADPVSCSRCSTWI